ncbi:dipeptide/oligopeptide/nickel ABC transporter permease/ATP-binding protein [Streptomyces sp. NBC_01716]|uniref:dipeptide/oligopeptide/nickel ABC transporter permease/ATP-binding protein n=1 Tax=Streptomyces sp. NBC_01716 TaxID=2975917 RepID=UPI002E2EBC84|nr:dipeptide/oligopeptide/nickel ABC transporter permease/ATP-binding protein [Streptomyces sp. NBC_01716]
MTLVDPTPREADASPRRASMRRVKASLRSPLGAGALCGVAIVLFFTVFGPVIWGEAAKLADLTALSEPPSAEHPLGTDAGGHDVLARVLSATRLSITTALAATLIGVSLGVPLGLLPVVTPRRVGRFINSAIGVAMAFPALLLAIVVSVTLGVGLLTATLAIGLAMVPSYARLTQALAASVAGRDFVAAARVLGVSPARVMFRHIFPNIRDTIIVNASTGAGTALVAATGLSFLGLGVQAPEYDWGRMLNESLGAIYVNPAASLGVAVAITVTGVTFALLGETLTRVLGLETTLPRAARRSPVHSTRPAPDESISAPKASAPAPKPDDLVLSVRGLRVEAPSGETWKRPVNDLSFDIHRGEIVGIVGESGSGKSLTCMAVASLLDHPLRVTAASICFDGMELTKSGAMAHPQMTPSLARHLGTRMAFVFQDPSTSLNPALHVGPQVAEIGVLHGGLRPRQALQRAIERLRAVKIDDPEGRARQYPHQFSGGMRQRAMIAMGLMGEPALMIADEPTTALDVTVQREVLALLDEVNREHDTAIMLVSHDISLISSFCTRVLVMYRGSLVESLRTEDLVQGRARHPYTRALAAAVPHLDATPGSEFTTIPENAEFSLESAQVTN